MTKEEDQNKTNNNIQKYIIIFILLCIIVYIYHYVYSVKTCYKQETCWKNYLCDMTCEYGKNTKPISCVKCASYCDMKDNICRCTKISYPNPNKIVDWKTFYSKCSK